MDRGSPREGPCHAVETVMLFNADDGPKLCTVCGHSECEDRDVTAVGPTKLSALMANDAAFSLVDWHVL